MLKHMSRALLSATKLLTALAISSSFAMAATPIVKTMPTTARIEQVQSMLGDNPKGMGEPCSNRTVWQAAAQYRGVDNVMRQATQRMREPLPAWNDAAYLKYSQTGSRFEGERMIAARRAFLFPLAISACITADASTIARLETVMLDLLSDPSWTLPAHDAKLANFRDKNYDIDLAAADFAHDIAQILYMLQGQLSDQTVRTTMSALEERVFSPMRATFKTGKGNWWLVGESNWQAVCLDGVTGAALAVIKDKKDRALFASVAEHYIPNYFNTFSDDGYAYEGASYWSYGFGHFASLRNVLMNATSDKLDLFAQHAKTRQMALYAYRFPMYGGNLAAFGDGKPAAILSPYALKLVNEAFQLGQPNVAENISVATFLIPRAAALIAQPTPQVAVRGEQVSIDPLRSYFPLAGILISRAQPNTENSLNISIKSGGNQGHSHDDNGSYVIGLGNSQPVGDPGTGSYTAKTFSAKRYDIKAINSYGHSVPLVDAKLQKRAGTYTAATPKLQASADTDTYTLDMRPAYDVSGLRKLERVMTHLRAANTITVQDVFEFSDEKTFETAIVSIGNVQKMDDKSYQFTHAGKTVTATLTASAGFELTPETVTEEGLTFQRLAVRFLQAQRQGFVSVVFKPKAQ
jgi:hypothetical protein